MFRNVWLCPVLACLGFLSAPVHADYYLLIMDLAKAPKFEEPTSKQGNMAGQGGMAGGPGGGMPGGPGGGMRGGPGAPGGAGGPAGAMGAGPGGMGMAGMMGGPGMGMAGMMGGAAGPVLQAPNPIVTVVALGEEREAGDGVAKKHQSFLFKLDNGMPVVATQGLGGSLGTVVIRNNENFNMTIMPLAIPNMAGGRVRNIPVKLTRARFDAYINTIKQVSSAGGTLDIAKWALEHGLLDSFHEYMTKLPTREDYKTDQKSSKIYSLYAQLKKDIDVRGAKNPTENILARLGLDSKNKVEGLDDPKTHYLIVTSEDVDDLKDKQKMLEEHFQSFFYTLCLKEIEAKVPLEKLVVYFPKNDGKSYKELVSLYQPSSGNDNGFLIRGNNTLVLTPTRNDANFQALNRILKPYWERGYQKEGLLKLPIPKTPIPNPIGVIGSGMQANAIPKIDMTNPNAQATFQSNVNEATFVMMANLMRKSLQHEAELAAISHNATRQLAQASGLFPEGITPPSWLENGLSLLMETPMGTPWKSTGGPNSVMVPLFRSHRRGVLSKGETAPGPIVYSIVTDQYYLQSSKYPGDKAAWGLAQSTAWSFNHFLLNQKAEGYKKYCSLLGEIPPGMEASPRVLDEIFTRAFAKRPGESPNQTYNDIGRAWWVSNQYQMDSADTILTANQMLKKEFGIDDSLANSPISLQSLLAGLAVPVGPQPGPGGMLGMPGMPGGMPGLGGNPAGGIGGGTGGDDR